MIYSVVPATADKPRPQYLTQQSTRTPHQKQVWVKALLESGMSIRSVAKQSGISVPTVMAIKRLIPSNLTEVETCKKTVVGSFYGLARGCQENITPSKLEESSAYQLMGMASLAVQAARDMEGLNRPVFNVVEVALNVQRLTEQSQDRLKAIETALAATDHPSDLT